MNEQQHTTVEQARDILRADYWDDVRGVVKDIQGVIDSGELTSDEDVDTYLWETCDGHGRVIYTAQAIECLRFSQHDGEAVDEGLIDTSQFKDGIPWSALAFYAFRADIQEMLPNEDFPWNNEDEDED